MEKINWHFERKALAKQYLKTVYQGAINRVALLDVRRTGKTEFLLKDFVPVALEHGFTPVYVNLWLEASNPSVAIISSLSVTIEALVDNKIDKLKAIASTNIKKVEVGNVFMAKVGLEFADANIEKIPPSDLLQINTLIAKLVSICGDKAILIIDEVQHLASNNEFDSIQRSLRTALDTHSELNVVYSGSSRSGINAMFSDKDKAFFNSAMMIDFPRLDEDFVRHCQNILHSHFGLNYSHAELMTFYHNVDRSPYWMMQLCNYLMANQVGMSVAVEFINDAIIVDGDFKNIFHSLNQVDKAVLKFILSGRVKVYSEQNMNYMSGSASKKLNPSQIQTSIKKLKTKGIVSQYGPKFYLELHGFSEYLSRHI